MTDSRTTAQATSHESNPADAMWLAKSPSNNPAAKLIRQNAPRSTAATKPTGGRMLRAANQARRSYTAAIGSGTVVLASNPHAAFHEWTPEATARKPPITSQTNNTSMERMRARPEATHGKV